MVDQGVIHSHTRTDRHLSTLCLEAAPATYIHTYLPTYKHDSFALFFPSSGALSFDAAHPGTGNNRVRKSVWEKKSPIFQGPMLTMLNTNPLPGNGAHKTSSKPKSDSLKTWRLLWATGGGGGRGEVVPHHDTTSFGLVRRELRNVSRIYESKYVLKGRKFKEASR